MSSEHVIMGSMSRSIRRKQRLAEKKAAKKKLKKITSAVDRMPDHCHKCGITMDKQNMGDNMDWYVEIDNASHIKLTCPKCRESK